MSTETLRLFFTYIIAGLVLIGGFILLVIPSQVGSEGLVPFVTGIVGIVLGWVFNRDSTAGGQRSAERAAAQGASLALSPYPSAPQESVLSTQAVPSVLKDQKLPDA